MERSKYFPLMSTYKNIKHIKNEKRNVENVNVNEHVNVKVNVNVNVNENVNEK